MSCLQVDSKWCLMVIISVDFSIRQPHASGCLSGGDWMAVKLQIWRLSGFWCQQPTQSVATSPSRRPSGFTLQVYLAREEFTCVHQADVHSGMFPPASPVTTDWIHKNPRFTCRTRVGVWAMGVRMEKEKKKTLERLHIMLQNVVQSLCSICVLSPTYSLLSSLLYNLQDNQSITEWGERSFHWYFGSCRAVLFNQINIFGPQCPCLKDYSVFVQHNFKWFMENLPIHRCFCKTYLKCLKENAALEAEMFRCNAT